MIRHGTKPIKKDPRDYSFHRTFGAIVQPILLSDEFDADAHLSMPDQNADGFPFGCTGYETADMCCDQDGLVYDPIFTYRKTCEIEGHDMNEGCEIRNALKSACDYGMRAKAETDESHVGEHRRGAYFNCEQVPGFDWFDSFRSVIWQMRGERRTISIGTPWLPQFHTIGADGIMPPATYSGDALKFDWHNWGIKGWTQYNTKGALIRNGDIFLRAKTWQGSGFGDNGWCYIDRATMNQLMAIRLTGAFTVRKFLPSDVQTIKLDILQTALFYILRFLRAYNPLMTPSQAPQIDPPPQPAPEPTPTPSVPTPTRLDLSCAAIREFEGWGPPGSTINGVNFPNGTPSWQHNNPGNCKYSSVGYDPMYGVVKKSANGFAIFNSERTGMLYLKNLIRVTAKQHPNWTIYDYFALKHAPKSDGNDPVRYAAFVAKWVGVPVETPLKDLLA